jgi:aspartyl-tRNA(Asn)/glutamyl-tRNA(Gln) amidotransferase subunit A
MTAAFFEGASAVDRTSLALKNMEAWNPKINAIILPTPEAALQAAEELDRGARAGRDPGLLYGMTLSVKDNVDIAGLPTTAASKILANNIPNRDAFVIQKLKRQGAVIVGKANLHEWVFGPTSQSKHYGPCRNPWNTDHVPGGSSGGSGASVAADMCVASIGSDTGGSIRMPASFNGVAALRPTTGRISSSGTIAVSAAYDTLGPMARRVSDVARVFCAIAGHDPDDPISVDEPVPNALAQIAEPVAGMRIGIMKRWFFDGLAPELDRAIEDALRVYRDLGVEIVEIDLGDVELSQEMFGFRVIMADGYHVQKDRLAQRPQDFGEDVRERFLIGSRVTGEQYAEALRWAERLKHRLRRTFASVDAILGPTTPVPAPSAIDLDFFAVIREITRFSLIWPAAGVPALAVPCGFSEKGLPLSFQLAGGWFKEDAVLRLGHAFQTVTAHHLRTPTLPL